jgi:hypothetical protein
LLLIDFIPFAQFGVVAKSRKNQFNFQSAFGLQ